jgi:hypothetical protein
MVTYPNEVDYAPARRIALMGAFAGGALGFYLGEVTFAVVQPIRGVAPNSPEAVALTWVVALVFAPVVGAVVWWRLKRGGIASLETLRPKELRIEPDYFEAHLPSAPRLVGPPAPATFRVSYDQVWKIGIDHGMYSVEWNASDRFMEAFWAFKVQNPWAEGAPASYSSEGKVAYQRFLDSMASGDVRCHIIVSKEKALRMREIWLPKVRAKKTSLPQVGV